MSSSTCETGRSWLGRLKPHFSLRTLFVCLTLLCLLCGALKWRVERTNNQRRLVEIFNVRGIGFAYDYQVTSDENGFHLHRNEFASIPERYPFLAWLGEDFFHDVVWVDATAAYESYYESVDAQDETEPAKYEDTIWAEVVECVKRLPQLQYLMIETSDCFTTRILTTLPQRRTFSELELSIYDDAEEELDWDFILQDYQQLRSLSISMESSRSIGPRSVLTRMSRLRRLSIQYSQKPKVLGEFLQSLAPESDISELTLRHVILDDKTVAHIARLPKLKRFEARNCRFEDGTLESLEHAKTLKSLTLDDCDLEDAACDSIARLPRMEIACLNSNRIGVRGLEALAAAPSLRVLTLNDNFLSDAKSPAPGGFTKLEELSLSRCRVNSDVFACVAKIPGLTTLDLSGIGLIDQDFKSNPLPQTLLSLNIDSSHITVKTLKSLLQRYPQIELRISTEFISPEELAEMKKLYPGATINQPMFQGSGFSGNAGSFF